MLAETGLGHSRLFSQARRKPFSGNAVNAILRRCNGNSGRPGICCLHSQSAIRAQGSDSSRTRPDREESRKVFSFREGGVRLPTQGESLVKGVEPPGIQLQEQERDEGPPDFMFLSVSLNFIIAGALAFCPGSILSGTQG